MSELKLDNVSIDEDEIKSLFNHSIDLINFLKDYALEAYGADADDILISYFDNKELEELVVAYRELSKTQKFTIKILTGKYGYLKKIHTYANDNSTYDLVCGALTGSKSEHFTIDEIEKLKETEKSIKWYDEDNVLIEPIDNN